MKKERFKANLISDCNLLPARRSVCVQYVWRWGRKERERERERRERILLKFCAIWKVKSRRRRTVWRN